MAFVKGKKNINRHYISAMFFHAKLPTIFEVEVLMIVHYLQNIHSKKIINDNEASYELWFGHILDLSNLKVFDYKSHILIHKKLKQTLDTCSVQCIF